MEVLKENPFVVLTPDDKAVHNTIELSNAQIIHKLFVDVFEDFKSIPQQGHVFLNGPRGSGKSMMFRFLLPDCQLIDKETANYNELPFFSIHIPIKLTSINNPEYELIKDYGNSIFNEHVLCIYFADLIFDSFTKLNFKNLDTELITDQIMKFYNQSFLKRLKQCGGNIKALPDFNPQSPSEAFSIIQEICSDLFVEANQYLKRNVQNLKYPNQFSSVQYNGPLCDYLSFLFPLLKDLKQISSLFPNKPFFLLIDDADNLTEAQVVVLNTWVSYRTNSEVSLKISTQLNYPSYNTINGTNIDSPHDYYDINILTTYSSSKDIYNKRIRQIIERRLNFFFEGKGVTLSSDDFFPSDFAQEKRINEIKEKIRDNYKEGKGRGYNIGDDVKRYAIPEYIKSLKGTSKSGSTFKYAGFDMLVSISSGVIRHFLTPASKMFNAQYRDLKLKNTEIVPTDVRLIEPSIQNEEIRNYSVNQLFDEYDKYTKDKLQLAKDEKYLNKISKLRNLIESLGGLFGEYITSTDRSERKIFSFAITGNVEQELKDVIDLGVRLGYFHKSTIGKKNGTGKTRLYILSRILAPHFTLDPTSFAGYQFFTSEKLMRALHKPDTFIKEMLKIKEGEEDKETLQAKLDFDYPLDN